MGASSVNNPCAAGRGFKAVSRHSTPSPSLPASHFEAEAGQEGIIAAAAILALHAAAGKEQEASRSGMCWQLGAKLLPSTANRGGSKAAGSFHSRRNSGGVGSSASTHILHSPLTDGGSGPWPSAALARTGAAPPCDSRAGRRC